jgi:hypothetical protein
MEAASKKELLCGLRKIVETYRKFSLWGTKNRPVFGEGPA